MPPMNAVIIQDMESQLRMNGKAKRPSAYMIRGVAAAFMDLAYGGDYDPTGERGMDRTDSSG